MKNKELLNICYRFFNRFITANKLIEQLNNIDKEELSKKDVEETNKLIEKIKEIEKDNPNEVDEYVIKKKESIKRIIDKLELVPKDERSIDFVNRQLECLKKDYNNEIDSHKRWVAITSYIQKNKYFNDIYASLTDYELLEFISQNIQAPCPPVLTQEEFNRLVKEGIKNDKKELLWRLAFNYENKNINFDDIIDYFIDKKDGFYITELISAIGNCLDIDGIINKITDKELIEDILKRKNIIKYYVTDEQFSILSDKLN